MDNDRDKSQEFKKEKERVIRVQAGVLHFLFHK